LHREAGHQTIALADREIRPRNRAAGGTYAPMCDAIATSHAVFGNPLHVLDNEMPNRYVGFPRMMLALPKPFSAMIVLQNRMKCSFAVSGPSSLYLVNYRLSFVDSHTSLSPAIIGLHFSFVLSVHLYMSSTSHGIAFYFPNA